MPESAPPFFINFDSKYSCEPVTSPGLSRNGPQWNEIVHTRISSSKIWNWALGMVRPKSSNNPKHQTITPKKTNLDGFPTSYRYWLWINRSISCISSKLQGYLTVRRRKAVNSYGKKHWNLGRFCDMKRDLKKRLVTKGGKSYFPTILTWTSGYCILEFSSIERTPLSPQKLRHTSSP